MKVGQRLLEVNGTTLLGASHAEAVAALRGAPERLHLLVCFGYDPVEVENKKKVETEVKGELGGWVMGHINYIMHSSSILRAC